MFDHSRVRRFTRTLAVAALAAVAALGLTASAVSAPGDRHSYIVQLTGDPAAALVAPGEKLNPNKGEIKKHVAELNGKHDELAAKYGAEKFYDYAYAVNGFAARMTEAQAERLAKDSAVAKVERDDLAQVDTATTPGFLGLTGPTGLWSKLGGVGNAGEGVIVGIVDTGIWPEHPSFSDQTDHAFRPGSSGKRSYAYGPVPSDWHGTCQSGEQWSQDHCNRKLIGARYFLSGFGHFGVIQSDFKSARDADDHGSHTASTAAGNANVDTTGPADSFGSVSGMAPRARIAVYKACWNGDAGGCAQSDTTAAIDAAVADGVDVINYSISGTRTSYLNAVEVAFLFARRAGVFVATSAGNSGPDATTVAHISPWLSSVAAGTHDRPAKGIVALGSSATYTGASSLTDPLASKPLVLSSAVGTAGAPANQVALCYPGTLDAAKATGKIVVCDRGVIARVDKSLAVMQAGGAGMVLANTSENSLNADLHYVPTVHVDHVAGADIKAYVAAAGAGATASLAPSPTADPAPAIAAFSSRGPSIAGGGDILKPDMTAPGVDVLAAVSPHVGGRSFDLLSGTSMSSPHVAGLAALLRQEHPSWSPAAIQSALMTTATDLVSGANPFDQGAGHVRPNSAVDPGLVYDLGARNGYFDYLKFLCGQGLLGAATCTHPLVGGPIDASDLNLASIAIGQLAGTQTVTRTVTNVDNESATYTASVDLDGIDVTVTPSSFTIAPGGTQTYTVEFTTGDDATLDEYATGFLTWSDEHGHSVRSPIAVKPVAIAAPVELESDGTPTSWNVTLGYNGDLNASVEGLVAATETPWTVAQDPDQTFDPGDPTGTFKVEVVVPDGNLFRAGIYEDAITPTGTDIDLFVFSGDDFVGQSADGDSNEVVTVRNTTGEDVTYTVYVHGWFTNGASATGTLFTWSLGDADAGNTTISGVESAVTGGEQTHTAEFSGLTAGERYLGRVVYDDGTSGIGSMLLSVRP